MADLPDEEPRGIPAWVVTFADLMSLLMCFFVLLLSFAEIDATKFKQIAAEMAKAFGVQREVPAAEIPMGTSPIFDKFSPGKPEPTPLKEVRQKTSQDDPKLQTFTSDARVENTVKEISQQQVMNSMRELEKVLKPEIDAGTLQMEQDRKRIVIRVEEKGSFPSGSADMTGAFKGLLDRISEVFMELPGIVTIEGHTDDVPISTARFRSNWDLSAARASSVANALLDSQKVEPVRVQVQGFADTRPRVANDSPANRAVNRRVEIILDLSEPLEEFEAAVRDLLERGRDDLVQKIEW